MSLVVGLVSVPILVNSLGQDVYGVWLLLGQLIAYLSLVDFGNASIVKLTLASRSHSADTSLKQAMLTSTLLGILVTTPLVIVVGAVLTVWVSVAFCDSNVSSSSIALTAIILIVAFLATRFASLPTFALFGANLEYRSALSRTVTSAVSSLLDIVVVLAGLGIVGLACNRLVTQLILGLNVQRTAKQGVPWYGFTRFDWAGLWPLLKQNSHCLVAQWGNTLVESVDIVVVGMAMGADAVPIYTITSALPRLLFTLSSQAMSGATAGLLGLFGSGDKLRFHFIRTQQEIVTFACLAVVGALTLAVNRKFVTLWVGAEYYGGDALTAITVGWYFAVISSRQYCTALSAAFDFRHMARVQVASGLIGFAAGIAGGRFAGVPGVVLGLAAVRLATNVFNARRLDELLAIESRGHLRVLVRPFMVTLACCFAGWMVGKLLPASDWLQTAAVCVGMATAAGVVVWFLGIPTVARRDLLERFGRLQHGLR